MCVYVVYTSGENNIMKASQVTKMSIPPPNNTGTQGAGGVPGESEGPEIKNFTHTHAHCAAQKRSLGAYPHGE